MEDELNPHLELSEDEVIEQQEREQLERIVL